MLCFRWTPEYGGYVKYPYGATQREDQPSLSRAKLRHYRGDLFVDASFDGPIVGPVAGDELFDKVVQRLGAQCVDRNLYAAVAAFLRVVRHFKKVP